MSRPELEEVESRDGGDESPAGRLLGVGVGGTTVGVAANIIARYIERYRWIAYVGLAVILYVALKMIYDGWIDPQVGLGRLFG